MQSNNQNIMSHTDIMPEIITICTEMCDTVELNMSAISCANQGATVELATTQNSTVVLNMDSLKQIILNNGYVQSCVSNKTKDPSSLSYLVSRDLSQSDCIKLGNGIELVLKDVIMAWSYLENIRPANQKGKKERDHLFRDNAKKIVYYAELKSNLNLDTEKCKSTSEKCVQILHELQEEFPDCEIKMCLVGIRYYTKDIIPKTIANKYTSIQQHVVGVDEYFARLGLAFSFETEEKYKEFINYLADSMFNV
jgi:hypothetical protein